MLMLILFLTGLLAGTVDAIAGGGGLISVPVLLSVGLPPHVVFGTNKISGRDWYHGRSATLLPCRLGKKQKIFILVCLPAHWAPWREPSSIRLLAPMFLKLIAPILLTPSSSTHYYRRVSVMSIVRQKSVHLFFIWCLVSRSLLRRFFWSGRGRVLGLPHDVFPGL